MSNLQHRQSIIQAKRKQTPWREFVMEICSWYPIVFSKEFGKPSRFPKSDRIAGVVSFLEFEQVRGNKIGVYSGDFLLSLRELSSRSLFSYFIHRGGNENCEYSDVAIGAKNCYLSMTMVEKVENILYSRSVKNNCDNVISSMMVWKNCSQIFESSCVINSRNIFYSHTIQNSNEIRFSQNCINCSNCILCFGIENKSYCIRNKQYEKHEYENAKNDVLNCKDKYTEYRNELGIQEGNQGSKNSHGKCIINSSEIQNGYYVNQTQNARNVVLFGSAVDDEEIYDVLAAGSPIGKNMYGGLSLSGEHIYNSCHCSQGYNLMYCYYMTDCSFCLGCIGLKNKSYCILNKQYTKEERYAKVDEIFGQMNADGTLGEFFPATMNPFYFNDTAAYLIDPSFTKEEVTAKGYLWRDEAIKVDIPADAQIVSISELDQYEGYDADGKRTIKPSILDKVIQDPQGNVYKIVKMELAFLIKHGLPLPRKHWLERMKENFRIG